MRGSHPINSQRTGAGGFRTRVHGRVRPSQLRRARGLAAAGPRDYRRALAAMEQHRVRKRSADPEARKLER